ncbi:hypothetical protein EJ02DRAFT_460040 [Clathrospora elynae]|uniref:Fungal-type protein kinase domain-containing protein n=1 Tax=Clathrospora elynae TaxID=706981 RepID=A0A6A5S7P0_9PLEO|nr:hypothetical protein EJ02DRAFT_460040 [Clathrospora elynae]
MGDDSLDNSESSVYRRLEEEQGKSMPRLIGRVELPHYYSSRYCSADTEHRIADFKGLLMQFIDSFTLEALFQADISPAPRDAYESIIDNAIQKIHNIIARGFLKHKGRTHKVVVRWVAIDRRYQTYFIDLTNWRLRKDESDRDWRLEQANMEEEGAIGQVMQGRLKKFRRGGYTYKWTEQKEQLQDDFRGEDGPRI